MRALTRLLFAASLLTCLTVFAQRGKMSEFKEDRSSADARDKAKRGAKYNMGSWSGDTSQQTAPFPWMAAGLVVIALLVAAPFAIKMYANTAKEQADANSFGAQGPAETEDEQA
jgi:hypothetical protein